MENKETSNSQEIEAEQSSNQESVGPDSSSGEAREDDGEMSQEKSIPNDTNRELSETEKKDIVKNSYRRAKLARDARRIKTKIHNGQPCPGKNCDMCIDNAAYRDGGLEMSKLSEEKYLKYFCTEDQNAYIHPDFYPSIRFEPTHDHCKEICCVCTRYPYLRGTNKELLEQANFKKDEPLSETCIKCKGVRRQYCT